MYPGHWDGGGWLIWPFRCVATCVRLAHALGVRSLPGLGRALPSGQLNQPPIVEQLVAAEAGVAWASVGVQDPKGRPPAWWTGAIARDDHLRSLADHVPAEPDPRSTGQLQPDAGRLADRGADAGLRFELAAALEAGRLEDHERDAGTARECGKAPESIGESRLRANPAPAGTGRRLGQAGGQVDDEEVHCPTREERAGDREALLGLRGGQHDQPLRLDPASDGLDRIQGLGQVQPGHDGAGRLRLSGESQRERGPPARGVTPKRHAHPPGQAAGAEDRIQLREARRKDPIRVRLVAGSTSRIRVTRRPQRHRCQRSDDVAGIPGRRRTPARPKGRQGCVQVHRGSRHVDQYRTSVRMNQGLDSSV